MARFFVVVAAVSAFGCVPEERPADKKAPEAVRTAPVGEAMRRPLTSPPHSPTTFPGAHLATLPSSSSVASSEVPTKGPVPGQRGAMLPGVRTGLIASPPPPSSVFATAPAKSDDPALDPLLAREYTDRFDRAALGDDWGTTAPEWRIEGGRLCVQNAHNHPAWLRRRLPVNARIEFDATSSSPDGDMKAEYWGDGHSAAQTISYNAATSYLTIFGGWKNQFHVLARIDEHAPGRPEVRIDDSSDDIRARRVEPNRTYHFKVVRDDGKTVHWYVDDIEILTYADAQPLKGAGHDHFGFNDWEVRACFDNLVVVPLP